MSKKVIHYDTCQFHVMPISGRHIICLCGKWFQGNYGQDKDRYTTEKENVTCKNCLNKLNKG